MKCGSSILIHVCIISTCNDGNEDYGGTQMRCDEVLMIDHKTWNGIPWIEGVVGAAALMGGTFNFHHNFFLFNV